MTDRSTPVGKQRAREVAKTEHDDKQRDIGYKLALREVADALAFDPDTLNVQAVIDFHSGMMASRPDVAQCERRGYDRGKKEGIDCQWCAMEANRAHNIIRTELCARHGKEADGMRRRVDIVESRLQVANEALLKVNEIRNSIVGMQGFNFSEHAYPLVAALDDAGVEGLGYPKAMENVGTMLERANAAEGALQTHKEGRAAALDLLRWAIPVLADYSAADGVLLCDDWLRDARALVAATTPTEES